MAISITPVLIIDIVGMIVGLVSIFIILNLSKNIGGDVGKALNLIVFGITFMLLALLETIVFGRLSLLQNLKPSVDVHHLFMAVGMIFFVVAAKQFAKLKNP